MDLRRAGQKRRIQWNLARAHHLSWSACMDDKVRVDFSYYRDASGQLHERRRVEGETIYDEPVLYWHGQKPWIEISLDAWPWEDKNV